MFDWTLVTRCCVGCSRALHDRSSANTTPSRTRDGSSAARRRTRPTPNGTADWHGHLRDSTRGRWLRRAD